MDNQTNNSYKTGAQNPSHKSSRDSQKPLIDVARSYCTNLNMPSPRENSTVPGKVQGSPYTWKAKTESENKTPSPVQTFSSPCNPYSWKAPSKPSGSGTASSENTPTASTDPSFPRPPRLPFPKSLPKLEPLTVSISQDSDSRSVKELPQQSPKQSPLQPFSPSGNSRECTCLRNPKVILCQSCGIILKGRLSMACKVHPRQVFLMDLNCCTECKSTSLKEICDAKK